LKDRASWPDFDRRDFLSELDGVAEDALCRRTVDGYLAALLIYAQLAEEIVRLLLRDAEFFVQLHVYPAEIHFPVPEMATLGELLGMFDRSLDFPSKQEVLKACRELNIIRRDLVHRLTASPTTDSVGPRVEQARVWFREAFSGFQEGHSWFHLAFKDLRKDDTWWERIETE
jgi:hypothetical protein